MSVKRQCWLPHLSCISPNSEYAATVALPKDLPVPCLAAFAFIVLLFRTFFAPIYNLLSIVKHQHSIRKLLHFLGMIIVYFTPYPSLAQKKSVLCSVSLHLHLFGQCVSNRVFCLLKEIYYLLNSICKGNIKRKCTEPVNLFVTTLPFPSPSCFDAHSAICRHIGRVTS